MMRITFLGVGESCDPLNPNTSILLECSKGNPCQVMLDCGFTTPHLYFKDNHNPDTLDALWISHFHGDHFFGVPLLFLRFWEMGREQPLIIAGQKGIQKKISQVMELAYPGFMRKMQYGIEFVEVEPGVKIDVVGLEWQTAVNEHSQRSLSVRIDKEGKSIFYSGDGRPTHDTEKLAKGCNLIIHESFWVEGKTYGHSSIQTTIEFAKKTGVDQLALVHLSHIVRKNKVNEIKKIIDRAEGINVLLPESGSLLSL